MGKHHHHHDNDDDGTGGGWPGYYRCDDLVPPLCDDTMKVTNGTVETLDGLFVTYWRYTPAILDAIKSPIVVINGGPGLPHNSEKPLRNLACDGREVVMYDQAGAGWSQLEEDQQENVDELYPELFTIDYYAGTELPAILEALAWAKYHIVAASWGTQIAFQFAVSTAHIHSRRRGLQSLILNAPIADNHKFIAYQWDPVDGSFGSMPSYIQERLLYFNATQDFDNDEFQYLQEYVISEFNARLGVLVDCWTETENAGITTLDLGKMMGFTDAFLPPADVSMHGWTVLPELHKLRHIPVQLNYGGYDFVRPRLVAETAAELGGPSMVECHRFMRAAHSILLDAPAEVYPKIKDFLLRVEDDTSPFYANGTCPPGADNVAGDDMLLNQDEWSPQYRHGAGATNTPTLATCLVLLVSMVATFKLGLWAGARKHRKDTGYEVVL